MNENNDSSPLEEARSFILTESIKPTSEKAAMRLTRYHEAHPFAVSTFLECMDMRERYAKAIFLKPRKKDEKFDPKIHIPEGEKFNPKIHWVLPDEDIRCEWAYHFIANLVNANSSFLGKLHEKLLEAVRDIGRPNAGLFGLGNLMGEERQELVVSEE